MWDFSFAKSLSAVIRTAPFIVLRLVVYVGIAFAYVFAVGMGAVIGYGLGHFWSTPDAPYGGALWGSLVGFGISSAALYLAREYILYLVKAGHIAVLVQLYDGRSIPAGQGQIAFGAQAVRTHFTESSVLFGVDQIIKAVLRSLFRILNTITAFLPIPGLRALVQLAEAVIRTSLTYVDEIILAYLIRTGTRNPWETAEDGLILYAQNYRHFLKNAIWLLVFMWAVTLGIFVVLLAPAAAMLALFPGHIAGWAFAFAFIFAWALKAAILEPLAIASLMQVFFKTVEGQTPNPEWKDRLNSASRRFRELAQKAAGWMPGPASPPPAATPNMGPA